MLLFWRQGYEATSISELTQELGLGRQSLYGAFGSKRQLFIETLRHYADTKLAATVAMLEAPGPALENIRKVLAAWQKGAQDRSSCGCLVANTIAELGVRDHEISATLGRDVDRLERAFHVALERAKAAGELPSARDPKALARLFVTTGQGLAVLSKAEPSSDFARDVVSGLNQLLSSSQAPRHGARPN